MGRSGGDVRLRQLRENLIPLHLAQRNLFVADKRACALLRRHNPLDLKLIVGARDGVRVDLQIDCKPPNGRQLATDAQPAVGDGHFYLYDDLTVEWYAACGIEDDA